MQAHHDKAVDEMTRSVESYQKITEQLKTTSDEQAKAMAELVRQTKETQSRVSESMQTAGDSVARYFTALEEGVSSLNRVLASLGEKQVVVDENLVLTSRRKSGWLSLFGRRNGR